MKPMVLPCRCTMAPGLRIVAALAVAVTTAAAGRIHSRDRGVTAAAKMLSRPHRSLLARGKRLPGDPMDPAHCHLQNSREFCPFDETCVADQDCSTCVSHPILNNETHTCEQAIPPFVKDVCGDKPGENCYDFGVGMIGCMDACAVPESKAAGQYGGCIRGAQAGCPQPICDQVCSCKGPAEDRICEEPCQQNCIKWADCVLYGDGIKATLRVDFQTFIDQCVFDKPPPDGQPPGKCVCGNSPLNQMKS
eukprot:gnl/TRDRNA2_/TRDRNA2_84545_c0_seq1.p1 gnl/TRDRNA2_/TRDRNA2_84545_c0~~gnl/TRDRNA2_/TRDRNA2_84545_c0_seq1.p1  ORF type:complete len:249 (+),score=32.55 gnl/TRDRNA2_/TRDRNA2_84545_c0_seq1:103-849(+)